MFKVFGMILAIVMMVSLVGCMEKVVDSSQIYYKDFIVYTVKDGKPLTGKKVSYYPNGKVEYMATYKNGKQNGESIGYFESGKMKFKSNFVDGKLQGEQFVYTENVKTNSKIVIKDGKEQK